jgi:hypothetical protein
MLRRAAREESLGINFIELKHETQVINELCEQVLHKISKMPTNGILINPQSGVREG